jgi:hypothetical protein
VEAIRASVVGLCLMGPNMVTNLDYLGQHYGHYGYWCLPGIISAYRRLFVLIFILSVKIPMINLVCLNLRLMLAVIGRPKPVRNKKVD